VASTEAVLPLERSLQQRLSELAAEELASLRLWADPGYGLDDVAVVLRMSRERVADCLAGIGRRVGCSVNDLKSLRLAKACEAEVLSRFKAGRWQ